jgi:hydroxypyruvate reductase
MLATDPYRQLAETIFLHAVASVKPQPLIHRHVQVQGKQLVLTGQVIDLSKVQRIYVVGAGKASAAMAAALEEKLPDAITDGVVITKAGHALPLEKIRVVEAGHPVPDQHGLDGTQCLLNLLEQTEAGDLVIVLLSGGGSALLIDLPDACTLSELQQFFTILLQCGADIREMNTIRKHLSCIKGGQLVKAARPASVYTLVLSDVIGDALDVIASGPTVPDPTTYPDAWQIIEKYRLSAVLPAAIRSHLQAGLRSERPETPKPGDPIFEQAFTQIIGSNAIALQAAATKAEALGFTTQILTSQLNGEAREVAGQLIQYAQQAAKDDTLPKPCCLLWGGETTVTVRGDGKGGRNQELALAAALALEHIPNIVLLSAGTDGTDGPTDSAGAVVDRNTVSQARQLGLHARHFLDHHNAYPFFQAVGGHIHTGPTLTNVMDILVVLIWK